MYFVAFLFAVIFIAFIVLFPFISKKIFKYEGCAGLATGICCNILCCVCAGACFGLWAILVYQRMDSLGYKSYSIPFTFTFSEFWDREDLLLKWRIHTYYYICYLLLDVCVFILLICCLKRAISRMTANNQIFTFISGFNLTFVIVFFIAFLTSVEAIGDDEEKFWFKANDISYGGRLFLFELFAFSYLLQIIGCTLLIFLWLKIGNKLMLFIGLGTFFGPFIILIIGIAAESSFVSDILTPILYWIACAAGLFFYFKNGNEGTQSGGEYTAQPM